MRYPAGHFAESAQPLAVCERLARGLTFFALGDFHGDTGHALCATLCVAVDPTAQHEPADTAGFGLYDARLDPQAATVFDDLAYRFLDRRAVLGVDERERLG